MSELSLIGRARESALQGGVLDRDSIMALLKLDPGSPAAEKLGAAARDVAAELTGNRGSVWASIGVDFKKCPMNCSFCSFGEKWDLVTEEYQWSINDIIGFTNTFVSGGARWITLRTTQFYGIERLAELAGKVRQAVPGTYELVANTGEFDRVDAERLLKAGFQIAYHTLRLGEGADTRFNPQERTATLEVIKNSSLKLAYLVEPVGVEHSAEEIADTFLTGMKYGAALTGAMARVPVQGTPLGGLPAVSERRLAQVVAVTRLAAGRNAPDICVHPPAPLALEWGANLVVVENGAVPRDTGNSRDEWRCFGLGQAKELFERAGYKTW